MKKLLLFSTFTLSLSLPTAVKAQQTVSNTTINQAITDTKQYFCSKGSGGFAEHIQKCYQKNDSSDKCILEDNSLFYFDQEFRKLLKNQTGQEAPPPDEFLTQTAMNTRAQTYLLPKFGSLDKAYNYLRPGVEKIMDIMGKCLAENMQKNQNITSATPPQNNTPTITKEGNGETQTPPIQLNCPCMVTWKMEKAGEMIEYFDFKLNPIAGGFPISIATMSQKPQGEYYIPAAQSGQYMMTILSTGHWNIQIQPNYRQ